MASPAVLQLPLHLSSTLASTSLLHPSSHCLIQGYLFALVTAPFSSNPQPISPDHTFPSIFQFEIIEGEHLRHNSGFSAQLRYSKQRRKRKAEPELTA